MVQKNLDQWFRDMIGAGVFDNTTIHRMVYDELEARIMVQPIPEKEFYQSTEGPIIDLDPTEYKRNV